MTCRRLDEFTAAALGALPAVYNAAHRLSGNDQDAGDLVQDTYLEPDPLQVASSDPGTVTAWFADRLPFPARIPDLRNPTLLAGRLWGHKALPPRAVARTALPPAIDAAAPSELGGST
jgi:hypothetical protein